MSGKEPPPNKDDLATLKQQVSGKSDSSDKTAEKPLSKTELIAQKDIEDLLAEMAISTPPGSGEQKQPETDKPAAAAAQVAETKQQTSPVSSSASTQALDPDKKPGTKRVSQTELPTKRHDPKLGLTKADLDSLVAKHSAPPTAAVGDKEVMLSQEDIDALVQQLSKSTGTNEQMTEILKKHGTTIDVLMQREADTARLAKANAATDATLIDPFAGRQAMLAAGQMAMMAPTELRSTRWLLGAAVVFLALCAVMLTSMISAISGLSAALREDRLSATVATTPGDESYSSDFDAAFNYLQSDDEVEAAKGAEFLQKLKRKYPDHQVDLSLTLARYYRSHAAHGKAAVEYSEVVDRGASRGDPQIYIDYATSLIEVRDHQTALKVVYTLLANEQDYFAGEHKSPEDLAKARAVVQQGYLLLGKLLGDGSAESATVMHSAAEETGHGEHVEHAAHEAHAEHATEASHEHE